MTLPHYPHRALVGYAECMAPARFAFMKKFEIPEFDNDGNYLTRWRIIQTPWFALYLHRIDAPDSRPTLHDHPWSFLAIVLRGGYVERRLDPITMRVNEHHMVRRFNLMRKHDFHAIMNLFEKPTWTLLFVGARRRTWGYLEPTDGAQWIWTEFDKHPHAIEFDAALARRR
jgi:hypothetical protein